IAIGQIKRKIPIKTNRRQTYSFGISFYAIHHDDREEITGYTFQVQRRLLRMRRQMSDNEDESV
ncbi:MAG: hypothetical protein ACE5FU_12730, partial [Nitrospinota bacterium]